MPKGTVVTDQGKKMQLAPRTEAGLAPCPGEAHSNPFIDNCMLCAPRWGQMMTYKPPTVEQVLEGFAVPLADCGDGTREAFEEAEHEGKIKIVHVTENKKGCTSTYYVWAKSG